MSTKHSVRTLGSMVLLVQVFSCTMDHAENKLAHHGRPSPQVTQAIEFTKQNFNLVDEVEAEIAAQLSSITPEPQKTEPPTSTPPKNGEDRAALIDAEESIADDYGDKNWAYLDSKSESIVEPDPTIEPDTRDQTEGLDAEMVQWVNKEFFLSSTFVPQNLTLIPKKIVAAGRVNEGYKMREKALEALVKLVEFAEASAGLKLRVLSAYRSYAVQDTVFKGWCRSREAELGKVEGRIFCERESAWPGHSEHQLGTVVDLTTPELAGLSDPFPGFEKSKEGIWLKDHAHLFGFTISYHEETEGITGYMYEPWHIRYLGRPLATHLYKINQVTEEYFLSVVQPPELVLEDEGGEKACSKYAAKFGSKEWQFWTCNGAAEIKRCDKDLKVVRYTCKSGCYACTSPSHDFCADEDFSGIIAKEKGCKLMTAK